MWVIDFKNVSISIIDFNKHNKAREFGQQRSAPCASGTTFLSASLTALKKFKGGVRPIAVGEVFRRLVAKCIAKKTQTESAELIKGGAESIIHATKLHLRNCSFKRMQE